VAGIYFWWRRAGWIWGVVLTLIFSVSVVGALFIAADMSRSTMIVLPALVLGIWLWSKTQPQTFKWALPAVLVANLALPAAHVMWNLRIPIHYLPAVLAESTPWYVDPPMLLKQAQDYVDEGKPAEAEVAIDAALKLDDHFALAYVRRAVQRGLRGDFKGARVDIQSALTITPNSADALFVSGVIATKLNDVTSAKADFQKALQNAPVDWPHRYETKQILEKLNEAGSRASP
jgi:tetratricopeptide (TPR) repeat protein